MLEEVIKSLVDRRSGIITSIDYIAPSHGGPTIHTYRGALATPYSSLSDENYRENVSQIRVTGIGIEQEDALWSLVGEAVERYSAYSFDSSRTIVAKLCEVEDVSISPNEWIGFDWATKTSDFPYQPYSGQNEIRWVLAEDYRSNVQVYVPAGFVWLRLGRPFPGENFNQRVSTGLGAGQTVAQARLSGLLELVERDALSSRWLLSATPQKKVINAEIELQLGRDFIEAGLVVELYDLAVDRFAQVTLAKLTLPHRDFGFCLGASAACNIYDSDRKALLEAYHILQGMVFWQGKNPKILEPMDVHDFVDHGRYYSMRSAAESAGWFFQSHVGDSSGCGYDVNFH